MSINIAIVEDEVAIADTIAYALSTEGYTTFHVTTGQALFSLLEEREIRAVILDIGLPDISGLDVCKELHKKKQIPVIFLTARSDEIDKVVGLEIGGDDYITKPFSPRELSARVKAVLRRSVFAVAEEEEGHSVFHVDEARHKITYLGRALDFSRYEFAIMAQLIKHSGQVFSRDKLMELVWDEPDSALDRTVDVHIKNIRSKLRAVRKDPDPIVTHRGVGYSLREEL